MSDPTTAATGSRDHNYLLGYGLWQCDHCGSQFVAMAGCEACGKDGPQVDDLVNERRAIAERVRPVLYSAEQAEPLDLVSVWAELISWLDRYYLALAAIGQREQDGELRVSDSLTELARLRSAAALTPRLRPLVAIWRELDQVVNGLTKVAAANLDALEASTPTDAQAHEARAQRLIDDAGRRVRKCGDLLARIGMSVDASFFDAFARDTVEAFRAADAQGLTDFDAKGAAIYHRITGGARFPSGLGVSLMLVQSKIDEAFDGDRFNRDVRAAFESFTARSADLDLLIADGDWRKRVSRATRELFSAGVEVFDLARGSVQNQWFETRAILRLALLLAEGVAPIYMETLLALRRRHEWKRYRGKDPGTLLKAIAQTGLGDLVQGIDIGIRHADAHRAYEQLEEAIALTDRQGVLEREVSEEKLVDLVLAAMESCLLLHTALSCAMTVRGVPVEELDVASDLIPTDDQLGFLVSAAGLADARVEKSASTVTLRGSGSLAPAAVLPTVAALSTAAPVEIDQLELVITDDDGVEWRAVGPLQPLRTFGAASGIERECATVESAARWKLRGGAVLGRSDVRRWSAMRVGTTLDGDRRVTLDVLDKLAQMAKRLGDGRLRQTLDAFGRFIRAPLAGLAPPQNDAWASQQLVQWMNGVEASADDGPLTA
jgi:hypothetical protein